MRAYTVEAGAGLGSLKRQSVAERELEPGEVRIKVGAAALNYRDLLIVGGGYRPSPHPTLIPLSDGAGEVVEVGAAVGRLKIGDRVVASFWPRWSDGDITPEATSASLGFEHDGMLAERFVAPEGAFARAPMDLSMAEASTLPCAGVTAWNALFVEGGLKPGATVLVMGTGGVSIWALQLAKAAGLRPIVLSSSHEKLDRARSLGADVAINYRDTPDWERSVLASTGGRGVDLAVDVGGEGTLARSLSATRVGGKVVVVGGLTGFGGASVSPGMLIGVGKRLAGISVGSRAMLDDLVRFVDMAGIRPVVDRSFGFDAAPEAYVHLEAGRHFGKVVVDVAGPAAS